MAVAIFDKAKGPDETLAVAENGFKCPQILDMTDSFHVSNNGVSYLSDDYTLSILPKDDHLWEMTIRIKSIDLDFQGSFDPTAQDSMVFATPFDPEKSMYFLTSKKVAV